MVNDYTTVTEVPGNMATRWQLATLYHRYHVASQYCEGKCVLEVACGPGIGLGYLARKATTVVGGDYTEQLLRIAQEHYKGRVPLVRLDAHSLPFGDTAFDVVILLEAIYLLADPYRFVAEARRVLRENGVLLICTVNKDWPGFVRSRFSTVYFSAPELYDLLREHRFDPELFGAFAVGASSLKERIATVLRKAALALVPQTMPGKELVKKLFWGSLSVIRPEVEDGMAELFPLVPIPCQSPNHQYKFTYAVGRAR